MKSGMNKETGEAITGVAYLRQRLQDVINTPIGSLVGRRDFGSRLYEMLDHNIDESFRMNAYIRMAEAIADPANGLDDFKLTEMLFAKGDAAHIEITLTGVYLVNNQSVTMDGIILDGRN